MDLNLNIREIRKAQHLTLAKLAGVVGISVPHLSEIERGKKNLNNRLMIRISDALGVDPRALISGNGADVEIDRVTAQLSDDDKRRVLEFARALRRSQADPE